LLSSAKALRLRPPRAELPPGFWEQHGWWVALLSALGLAIVSLVAWLFSRPRRELMIGPAAWARQMLEPLRDQPEDGAILSRVSQVLRQYVAASFGLSSDEMTTTEFCRLLSQREAAGSEFCAAASQFLRQCDQQKFAPSSAASGMGAVSQVLILIEMGESRLAALQAQTLSTATAGAPGANPAKA
jgi:hypothetical protein